jgi:hypothetical protein
MIRYPGLALLQLFAICVMFLAFDGSLRVFVVGTMAISLSCNIAAGIADRRSRTEGKS